MKLSPVTFTHDIKAADNIFKMIEFLIDNIFVQFGGRLFRQMIGITCSRNLVFFVI